MVVSMNKGGAMDNRFDHAAQPRRACRIRSRVRTIATHASVLSVLVLPDIIFTTTSIRADEILVPKDLPTIQAAIDVARSGDTIRVRAGTYEEQIIIDKNLTLKGAGADRTVIQAPTLLAPFAQNILLGVPAATIIEITDGATVKMSGVTVSGPIPCAVDTRGIAVLKNATLELEDSHVTRIRTEGGTCPVESALGRAIAVGLRPFLQIIGESEPGSIGHATITETVIDKYHFAGINVSSAEPGPPSTATISDNLIVGGSDIPVDGQGGIGLAWAIATVTDNTIRGNVCTRPPCGADPINEFQSFGIGTPFFPSAETVISDNTVSDNDVGIYEAGTVDFVVRDNVIRNNRLFGIIIQDGTAATADNTITGGRVGIAVVAGAADAVGHLKGDRIRRTSVAPVQELECCGFTATAIVED